MHKLESNNKIEHDYGRALSLKVNKNVTKLSSR